MHYFNKNGALRPSAPYSSIYAVWFDQIVLSQTDYDKIELKKISYKTPFRWRHRNNVTEKSHQTKVARFSILDPPNQKF